MADSFFFHLGYRKLEESDSITAISLSRDGRYLLANTTAKVLVEGHLEHGAVIELDGNEY